MELLSNLCSDFSDYNSPIYTLGDFNLDVLQYANSTQVTEYIDLLFSFGLIQIVANPTRVTLNSATLIDHILTNSSSSTNDITILTSKLSDHFPIILNKKNSLKKSGSEYFESRDFSQNNMDSFRNLLIRTDWTPVFISDCAQQSYTNFSNLFFNLYDTQFPMQRHKLNKNYHKLEKWMSSGILTSRREKIRLCNVSLNHPTVLNLEIYKCFRNVYNKVIRAAKKQYFDSELKKNQSNLKKSWQLLKTAINKKPAKSSLISKLYVNDDVINDPKDMATHFNKFFTSMPGSIVDDLHMVNPDTCPDFARDFFSHTPEDNHVPKFSFASQPISHEEIVEATNSLQPKTSLDHNGVSLFFIKQFIPILVNPLHHIIQLSLSQGRVPVQLKIAKVIPIYKSGDSCRMDNYRPISLLSNFSKILEKIVATRLTNYLELNNLLSNSQFGFRKNHSTLHPLVHFMNFLTTASNNRDHALAIFCDLRKAFDTVDHSILLKKLRKIGVHGTELDWFKHYLTDRQQFVTINGASSNLLSILLGVPQGSILGPLLFLIYINDLPMCSKLISFLFADDTTLLASNANINQLFSFVNEEFKKIVYYFRAHKLVLHPEKTVFMLFSNINAADIGENIYIDNNNFDNTYNLALKSPILCVNTLPSPKVKFLGVLLDPNLNFKSHIKSVSAKISNSLYHLRAAKNILSQKSLTTLYYSLIHSHLIYAIHVWSGTSKSIVNELFTKQKMAIRIIHNSKYNAHTESLFKASSILPFPSLADFFKIQFMHQYKFKFLPHSFSNTWLTNSQRNEDNNFPVLRNEDDYYVPLSRLRSSDYHPLIYFPKLWNDFPSIIRSTAIAIFSKRNLKHTFWKNSLITTNAIACFVPTVTWVNYFFILKKTLNSTNILSNTDCRLCARVGFSCLPPSAVVPLLLGPPLAPSFPSNTTP
jgi:hypothetical protein